MVACTLCAFISLVWLREQIITNGGPAWLEPNADPLPQLNVVSLSSECLKLALIIATQSRTVCLPFCKMDFRSNWC